MKKSDLRAEIERLGGNVEMLQRRNFELQAVLQDNASHINQQSAPYVAHAWNGYKSTLPGAKWLMENRSSTQVHARIMHLVRPIAGQGWLA